jgi:GDPmannose 4,6-dehydratase|tara:strand:+ start:103 stop:1134 length:1032 start_codon:yes stop_codon:yes gene_type:complete
MTKIAFITGITGQDGSYLAELLLKKKYKVYGIVRRNSILFNYKRIEHLREKIILKYGDMTDGMGLSNFINEIINENKDFERFEIYNLAAQSHVQVSFEIPQYTTDVDGVGVLRLLEIIKNLPTDIKDKTRFYQAGTSEMYGKVLEVPQNETTPFNPISPYAAAKLYGYYLVRTYRDGYNLFATNGILFNHESSRRGAHFVTMKIVNGIKDILTEKKELIELGNIDSMRDWGHTKDYVKGMWLMLQHDKPDDFVLATGEMYSVRTFIEKAFAYKNLLITWVGNGLEEVGIDQNGITRIKINPKFYRPCEVELLLGNPEKAQKILGWKRDYDTLDKLIVEMFNTQ